MDAAFAKIKQNFIKTQMESEALFGMGKEASVCKDMVG